MFLPRSPIVDFVPVNVDFFLPMFDRNAARHYGVATLLPTIRKLKACAKRKRWTMAATMEYRYEALAQQSEALRIIFESVSRGRDRRRSRGQTSILQSRCGKDI
jgi:hypothetical protein